MLISKDLEVRLRAVGATVSDDVLKLPALAGQPEHQLRVSDGRVFGRTANPNGKFLETDWREVAVERVLPYFVDNSPVASWLRACGANMLQIALISMSRPA